MSPNQSNKQTNTPIWLSYFPCIMISCKQTAYQTMNSNVFFHLTMNFCVLQFHANNTSGYDQLLCMHVFPFHDYKFIWFSPLFSISILIRFWLWENPGLALFIFDCIACWTYFSHHVWKLFLFSFATRCLSDEGLRNLHRKCRILCTHWVVVVGSSIVARLCPTIPPRDGAPVIRTNHPELWYHL